jgi:hypothetical protein
MRLLNGPRVSKDSKASKRKGTGMKAGDLVRVVKVPPGLRDYKDSPTKTLFDLCLGKTFRIVAIENNMIELHVGDLLGKLPYQHMIVIEPEFVEAVEKPL